MKIEFTLSDHIPTLLKQLEGCANLKGDGHYTIMKFTTNYRVAIGTVESRDEIEKMSVGTTLQDAIKQCICDFFDVPLCNSLEVWKGCNPDGFRKEL